MNETEKTVIGIAKEHGLDVGFFQGGIRVSSPAQLYEMEAQLARTQCDADGLCEPMAYFEMIEQCGICGKTT